MRCNSDGCFDFSTAPRLDEILDENGNYIFNPEMTGPPPVDALMRAMAEHGLNPGSIIPGGLERFDVEKRGDKAGWYIFFDDGICPAGSFGNWQAGLKKTWSFKAESEMKPHEVRAFRRHVQDMKEKRRHEEERRHAEAKKKAEKIWNESEPAPVDHPYLVKKNVPSYGLKISSKGQLIVPICDNMGEIHSLQFIPSQDGLKKKFLPGGAIHGFYFSIPGNEKIIICEGYATGATIHKATGATVIIAFNSGNMEAVAMVIRGVNPTAKITVCADNDLFTVHHSGQINPGLIEARKAAQAIGAGLSFPVFRHYKDKPTDFNDLACREGLDAVRQQINRAAKDRLVLGIISINDVELTEPEWIIENYAEKDTVLSIIGDPSSAKSLLAIDWLCCVASGKTWKGNSVNQGPVLYVCGEGRRGVVRRVKAWCIRNGTKRKELPLFITQNAAQLCDPEQSAAAIEEIREIGDRVGGFIAICVDTVARNYGPGDENSTKDMNLFVESSDNIRRLFESLVVLVHHTGVADKSRGRGNSALKGSLDVEYRMVRDKDDNVALSISKPPKDFDPPKPKLFALRVVELGYTAKNGTPVTSVILDEIDPPEKPAANTGCGKTQRAVLDVLDRLYEEYRGHLRSGGFDGSAARVEYKHWQDECMRACKMTTGSFRGATNRLKENGIIRIEGAHVYRCE